MILNLPEEIQWYIWKLYFSKHVVTDIEHAYKIYQINKIQKACKERLHVLNSPSSSPYGPLIEDIYM
jgi:hypothetical protein